MFLRVVYFQIVADELVQELPVSPVPLFQVVSTGKELLRWMLVPDLGVVFVFELEHPRFLCKRVEVQPDSVGQRESDVRIIRIGGLLNQINLGAHHRVVLADFKDANHDEGNEVHEPENGRLWSRVLVVPSRLGIRVFHSFELVVAIYAEECHAVPDHKQQERAYL